MFSDNIYDRTFESLINEELKINECLKINKLSLNVVTSKYILFQKKPKNIQILNLKINNINIDQVKEFNFLGLIIDINLTGKSTLNKYQKRVLRKLEFLTN